MRIALTANGPGEVAGWVRPLVRRLYERALDTDVYLFLVPDDYATGHEARMARALFPSAQVYDPKAYVGVALGRSAPDLPSKVDVVQYLGGDLTHAMRVQARLGGIPTTYKFSKPRYAERFARAFAVDAKNVEQLQSWKTPAERIMTVGNLAIDGALLEAQAPLEPGAPEDGILIMPGSRRHEIDNLVPLFFTAAARIFRERPEIPVAFGISPFNSNQQLREAVERGGHPRVWADKARIEEAGDRAWIVSLDGNVRIPIVRNALAAATRSRLVLTLPGTKCIELAALGVPMVSITPFNAPEMVTINGPLTYLDRIPVVGIPLKRAAAVAVAHRFRYHTQPNMDAGAMVIREVLSTVTGARIARILLDSYEDHAWLAETSTQLAGLYRDHVGAADRMAESLLELAG